MIRVSLAAVTSLMLSCSAFAADTVVMPKADAPKADAAVAVQSAELTAASQAQQAKGILTGQGYTAISELQRDEDGRWTGTATKDGKVQRVSVVLPPKAK
jgi:hypothetical protein